jgi:hypothetical protein
VFLSFYGVVFYKLMLAPSMRNPFRSEITVRNGSFPGAHVAVELKEAVP